MIKNERQYRITKNEADKFALALNDVQARLSGDPLMKELEENSLRSQLEELEQQLQEYDELRSGDRRVISIESFEELPHALIQARIATGLSQKELAERLGLKEQQIQRYESTDYQGASLGRLHKIVMALGIRIREDIFLPIKNDDRR